MYYSLHKPAHYGSYVYSLLKLKHLFLKSKDCDVLVYLASFEQGLHTFLSVHEVPDCAILWKEYYTPLYESFSFTAIPHVNTFHHLEQKHYTVISLEKSSYLRFK